VETALSEPMKLAYLDCPAGIAGDMCLGALVDAGVPGEYLIDQLSHLGLEGEYRLSFERVVKNGVAATKARVQLDRPAHAHRHLGTIRKMIEAAGLPERAAAMGLRVFEVLAEAEAQVHNTTPEKVHFHEVGATDALVDIVGTCLGLTWLEIDRLVVSALPVGGGLVRAAHGVMPVPTPAVARLFASRGVPVYSNGIHRELVTPTGAAIACALAESFGEMPAMAVTRVGLGAGDMDLPLPNVLRLWLGEPTELLLGRREIRLGRKHDQGPGHGEGHDHEHGSGHGHHHEHTHREYTHREHTHSPNHGEHHVHEHEHEHAHEHAHEEVVACLETQVDDLNPQVFGYLFERLLAAGAADVFTVPVGMKKSRPGTLLTVLCPPERFEACERILLAETSTLGVRRRFEVRSVLARHHDEVETAWGSVRIKVAGRDQTIYNVQPEYEDCRRLALSASQPLKVVQQAALAAWYKSHGGQAAEHRK
jgi:hypothetical protein